MGLCNLKWTANEEASLKDGIFKHGPGKWADILKGPQFRSVLCARSNVDLKQGMEYDSAYSNSRWAEVDAELMMIAQMSPEDAAAAAVAAVKKAEAAIAGAEVAEKEAEEAEIAAEEAKDFAEQLRKESSEKMARPANAAYAAPKRGKRHRIRW